MLKNILKINGVLELNKTEQKSLQGGRNWYEACTQKQGMCCHTRPWGEVSCDAGYCSPTGCRWL